MTTGLEDRARWIALLSRIATPVMSALAQGRLRATMPVEHDPRSKDRHTVTHLEAVARTLAGLAPWLGSTGGDEAEQSARATLLSLTQQALAVAVDPDSPDRLNFTEGSQPLVDAAFLAHAILRAPQPLLHDLPPLVQTRLLDALASTRSIKPVPNNWLLFAGIVEAALYRAGRWWDPMRVDYALRQHQQWYKGDSAYGDGEQFHFDYYNSFVIHPMLLDLVEAFQGRHADWDAMLPAVRQRAVRFAAVQERMIAPDGTFPPIGRSLVYRCAAFQHLAQMALRQELPEGVTPGQTRSALSAVIYKTLDAPGTFDAGGWLTIGLCGHQPSLGEFYISTGSVYLCTTAFLPLGLPPDAPFWRDPAARWTSQRAFAGEDLPADHAV